MAKKVLAFDFGASSGRAMIGEYDGKVVNVTEIHRFSNDTVCTGGRMYWDVMRLLFEVKTAINKAVKEHKIDAIGIDTWGVDFGMLNAHGELISNPNHYRDERTVGMPEEVFEKISAKELYSKIENSITTDGGVRILDDDVILEITDDDLTYLVDYTVVRANNAKNINEFGIFKVENGKAKELKPVIEKYLKEKQESYRAMDYFPEEVEKIDFATVKVFGNYVVFSFLNEADTEAFYKTIENELTK